MAEHTGNVFMLPHRHQAGPDSKLPTRRAYKARQQLTQAERTDRRLAKNRVTAARSRRGLVALPLCMNNTFVSTVGKA